MCFVVSAMVLVVFSGVVVLLVIVPNVNVPDAFLVLVQDCIGGGGVVVVISDTSSILLRSNCLVP